MNVSWNCPDTACAVQAISFMLVPRNGSFGVGVLYVVSYLSRI